MNFRRVLATTALLALVATGAGAQTIIKDDSAPLSVDGITNYQTDFNMVGGMKVSWTLTGGSYSAFWGSLAGAEANGVAAPSNSWGIWTSDFKLWGGATTDTYGSDVWNLWSKNLISFTLEALPGQGVFDLSLPNTGTENSSSGKTFDWDDSGVGGRATYSQPIAAPPLAPAFVGDLYGTLKVEFGDYVDTCPAGWSLSHGDCKQWTGAYSCPSGYSFFDSDTCVKSYYDWRGRLQYDYRDADKVYAYQDPTEVWQPETFGTSSKCRNSDSPTVNQSGDTYDNTKCWEKFSQDMDNYEGDNPGGPQDVVPEPATMTLLATGLAGMAAARRRRRKS